ncbi:DUF2798 domain-containing protein [Shinella sp. CPCC 101442]|uniref:DUF2798 domain-containing protein n=1 Tax=Shinella sp. CPCC 101442 TaxID=2932265 RepID=UPI00215305EB|nr:DUF2798 domain-containing protein [Shinella sp. CPCC 101442]MCR6499746.1 DUF2798 domain-containing protein [Shinella sp. CPCC 101442]
MSKTKTVILAQVFISGMMACLMTGFFSLLKLGPTLLWLDMWAHTFVVAWPVAFVFSLIVGPVAFKLAHAILKT